MRESKADQAVEGIYIVLSSISKGIAFLHQSVSVGNSMICIVSKKKVLNNTQGMTNTTEVKET